MELRYEGDNNHLDNIGLKGVISGITLILDDALIPQNGSLLFANIVKPLGGYNTTASAMASIHMDKKIPRQWGRALAISRWNISTNLFQIISLI